MTIAVVTVVIVTYFSKNNLTPRKPMRFLRAAFRDLAMFLCFIQVHFTYTSGFSYYLIIVNRFANTRYFTLYFSSLAPSLTSLVIILSLASKVPAKGFYHGPNLVLFTRYRPELAKISCIVYNHYNLKTYTLVWFNLKNKKSDMFTMNWGFSGEFKSSNFNI